MCIIVDRVHSQSENGLESRHSLTNTCFAEKELPGEFVEPAIPRKEIGKKVPSTLKLEMQYHRSSAKLLGNKSLLSLPMDTQRVELVKPLLIRHQSGVIDKCDITSGNTTKRNPLEVA